MIRLVEQQGNYHIYADVAHLGGPARVVVDDPAPEGWGPHRIGFAPPPVEVEPLLWDGDQA